MIRNVIYDIESKTLMILSLVVPSMRNMIDFVLSLCSLEVKYNWKGGFEPHCPLDAKYDDASLILYMISSLRL
jgi:hypothetical protein